MLKVVLLDSNAVLPVKMTPGSAGYDIYSSMSGVIKPHSRLLVSTSIAMQIPKNHVGQIWPRSGISVKSGIQTGAGIIDSDYIGEIKVLLYNHSDTEFSFENQTRIAQILILPIYNKFDIVECDNLEETKRGSGGFGSTG